MSKFYQNLLRPLAFKLPAETAHEIGLKALEHGLRPQIVKNYFSKQMDSEAFGELRRFGMRFKNPLGVAAGFDKNGVAVNQLGALGFGFVEVGTITFNPQTGNEKPRLFRVPADRALINRLGFNNQGALKVVERLKKIVPNGVLGVNIGKNKDVENERAIENYLASFDLAYPVADYIAVNVSSPNTPHLRELQKADSLEELLGALQNRNRDLSAGKNKKPLLVKIAPDLSEAEIEAIVDVCLKLDLAGIIATNTTVNRNNLKTQKIERIGAGGLSGTPLRQRSNEVVRKIYKFSKGKLPIIGVGGIFSAADAFEKIAAGACLIQSYTGLIYQGYTFARDVNSGLCEILRQNKIESLDAAIGIDCQI